MAEPKTTTNAAQGASSIVASLFKADLQINNDQLKGMFRDTMTVKEVTPQSLDALTFGTVNSAIRVGEFFRLKGLKILTQKVRGTVRELLVGIVENPKGEQRAIYMSTLFRSTPVANSENNEYGSDVLGYDQGILRDTAGMATTKRIELLMGDGKSFIHVADDISYETKAVRQVDTATPELPNNKQGDTFIIKNRVFKLEHVSEAEAQA